MRTLTRRGSASPRRALAVAAALGVVGLSILAATSTVSVGAGSGSVAVFGDNQTDDALRALGYSVTLVTDVEIAAPGFLDGFDALYLTRNGSEFGDGLSPEAAAAVAAYVGSSGNIVLLNGDFADSLVTGDPGITQLTANAVAFAVQSGHGFVGELSGAVSALSSNIDQYVPLGLIAGSAADIRTGSSDGTITETTAGSGHPLLAGVGLPFDPVDVDYGTSMTGVDSALVLATYANGAPAVIARGTANDAPAIGVPSDMVVEGNIVGGANVVFTVSASDSEDGDLSAHAACTVPSGTFFGLGGPYEVSCSVSDSAGESASDSFSITVVDTTAPEMTLVGGPASGTYYYGEPLVAPSCTAFDIVDGSVACTIDGYSAEVGTHTVAGSTTDRSSNRGEASGVTYSVLPWTLNGFFRPVEALDNLNVVKGGSTVPLQFEVFAGPNELTSTDIVAEFHAVGVPCADGLRSTVDQLTGVGIMLRYDDTGGQFIANWSTPKAAGSCQRVVLRLEDGSTISADFRLR
jgi:hypothetical protein